jgi:hypothetical protein
MSVSGWFQFLDFLLLLDEHELRGKRKNKRYDDILMLNLYWCIINNYQFLL